MYAVLGDELIHFACDQKQAGQQLGLLFRDWPKLFRETPPTDSFVGYRKPLSLILQTPAVPEPAPARSRSVFTDRSSGTTVFQGNNFWHICYGSGATAHIPLELDGELDVAITVQVARESLYAGRLEDIIFSSLAPALRRRGLFMIHAFAAEKDGGAVLIVGESGSGKTTTGLGLTLQGWRFLANDMVLLQEKEGAVLACPTPGGIALDGHSLEMLPDLAPPAGSDVTSKRYFPATDIVPGWGAAAPVSHILFTEVGAQDETELRPAPRSMSLARLMEASIDRWDTAGLTDHFRILELLSRQAMSFEARLGRTLGRLPGMLEQSPAAHSDQYGQA